MKRKALKAIVIIALSIIGIIVIIALSISPFAKNYIEKNSKDLIGREIRMNNLRFNIFTGSLLLDSIRMYEANNRDIFASIDSFFIDVTLYKLLGSKIEVSELKVTRPYAAILQNGDIFNFDDLIPQDSTTTKKDTVASSFPKSIVIKNISISGGKFVYTDLELKNTIHLNDLGVDIPELAFEQGKTDAGIHLKIGEKATLSSHLAMDMKTNEYLLKLKLGNLPIDIIHPYVGEYFNIGVLEGIINSDLLIAGDLEHVMDFKISGWAGANAFRLTNSLEEPIVSLDSLSVKMSNIHLASSTYLFDYVQASGANLDFILHPETDNFTSFFKDAEATDSVAADSVESSSMTLKINHLHLAKSNIVYTDNTLRSPFSLHVSEVDLQAENFDMNRTNEFKGKASFPKGGSLNASWTGNINDLGNQQILLNLRNLNLPLFSAYCLEYTAQDITSGKMNFVSKNGIRNNYIISTNDIDVHNMNVGKKHKEIKAEYSNIPLKLGLYVLKDKDDKIKFNIPVKGNISDPEFSYRRIIFQTIVNLIVKVAVSPVRFIASSLGFDPDEMASMEVDVLQSDLSASQYSLLDKLSEIYGQKPEMQLDFTQQMNLEKAMRSYALYRVKAEYLTSTNPSAESVIPTFEETEQLKNNDEKFIVFVNELLSKGGQSFAANTLIEDKALLLYNQDSIQSGLAEILEERNLQVKNYLLTNGKIQETNLMVKTASLDSLRIYNDKQQYKIEMKLSDSDAGEED